MNRPAELDRVFDGLRPHPHRGDLVAAGAVVLAVAIGMVNVRMDGLWDHGVFVVSNLLGFALIFAMGMLAELEDGRPRPYQSALLLAGLWLLALTLFRLAQLFDVPRPLGSEGTIFWTGLVLAGVAAWPAWARNSAICALIGVLVGGAALLAFVDLVFHPTGPTTFRWVLLLLLATYALASLWARDRERRHAVMMINAAAIAIVVLQVSFLGNIVPSVFGPPATVGFGVGFGWALIMLAGGFGLVAYSAVDREPGPGYLGVLVLAVAVLIVGFTGDHNLLFWPLFLLVVGIVAVAMGLRPRRRLPPEPGPGVTAQTRPIRPDDPEPGVTAQTRPLRSDDPEPGVTAQTRPLRSDDPEPGVTAQTRPIRPKGGGLFADPASAGEQPTQVSEPVVPVRRRKPVRRAETVEGEEPSEGPGRGGRAESAETVERAEPAETPRPIEPAEPPDDRPFPPPD